MRRVTLCGFICLSLLAAQLSSGFRGEAKAQTFFLTETFLNPTSGTRDFGMAVAIAGNRVLIGSPQDAAAFLYDARFISSTFSSMFFSP